MAAHEISHHHRRILAAPVSQTSVDPTFKKHHPKPTPSASAVTKPHAPPPIHHAPPPIHPLPDPTPQSTIQNISHRFSKLYANHKKLIPNSKPSTNPQHPQPKTPSLDTSCTTLTKSTSQHERHHRRIYKNLAPEINKDYVFTTKTKNKDKDEPTIKNPSSRKKQPSFEEYDVKKASQLMSKSFEDDDLKKNRSAAAQEQGRRSSVSSMVVVNGGRRSFCSSQVELADFLSCNGVKVVAVDMPPFMQVHAVDVARKVHDSLEKFTSKTLAFTLKKEFDGVYGPAWHCIVGTSFGSFVTHSVGGFMYFSMDSKLYILLFKTTVQRAEPN